MIKRPRQIDYFRTVTRINVWEEFNSFDNEGQSGNNASQNIQQSNNAQIATLNGDKNDKEGILKKQEIPIIAAASNIKAQNQLNSQSVSDELYKKRRIHLSNYVRIRQDQIWPLQEKYELADDDIIFFKDFNESHNFNMKEEELEALIESFELKSGKDFIITWIDMKDYIPNDVRDKYTFPNLEKIYNYWRVKRDHLKRPLLRLHWKPNFNDKDPHVAFRPRVAEKMKLRRSMKQNDDEQLTKLTTLKEEMAKYKLLVQQIKLREQMKEWILESQNLTFVSELYKVDKSMQYFFVDDVFENHKDLEQKKSQMEDKVANLNKQKTLLNNQLAAYNLFPHRHPLIRVTGPKPSKPIPEFVKTIEGNQSSIQTNTSTNSSTTVNPTNGQKIDKKHGKSDIRPIPQESQSQQPEIDLKDPKQKKISKKISKIKDESNTDTSGKLILTIPKDSISKITPTNNNSIGNNINNNNNNNAPANQPLKGDPNVSITPSQSSTIKDLDKNKQTQDVSAQHKGKSTNRKAEKLSEDIRHLSEKQGPAETPATSAQGNDISLTNVNQGGSQDPSKADKDSKDGQSSLVPGLSLFNTDNFEFASFVASIFIEASKRQLTVEKVINPDTKAIDREHYQHIINNKSELASQLKKSIAKQNASSGIYPNSNPKTSALQGEYVAQNPNHPLSMNPYSQSPNIGQAEYKGGMMHNPYINNVQGIIPNMPNPAQEPIHVKKKNVIPFKTRLRIGRSGLVNIDRQFDDKDNLRYEDICSKEANYHPNKVVDKILAQQRLKERQEQQKLKVFSFTPTDRELYNKDYFQQKQMKFKTLAEDNDETVFLYQPNTNNASNNSNSNNNNTPNYSMNLNASSNMINNNNNPASAVTLSNTSVNQGGSGQGYSSAQLTGVNSTPLTNSQNLEGCSMQIEDSINGLMLSSSLSSQQLFNNEQDIKILRKSISMALKNYQKSKQQSILK